jgi:hypothetical protein
MKLFVASALAIAMSTGLAIAQETSSTPPTKQSGTADAPTYLAGPNISKFYTDDSRNTVRAPAEFKKVWDEINDVDRADIRRACDQNRDVSYNPLCTNVKAM